MKITHKQVKNNRKITKKKINKTNQKGGVKLGEGSFGCVLSPPINCKKSSKYLDNYVSKLITLHDRSDINDINNEYNINIAIKKIDPKMKYFTTIIDKCILKKGNKRPDLKFVMHKRKSEPDKCLVKKNKKTINLIMKNAGLNLDDVLIYKKYKYARLLLRQNFRNIVYHLIKGIDMLHNGHIVHHDIKPDNFGLKINNETVNITYLDFGMSELKKGIDKRLNNLSRSAYGTPGYIAPDMYLISTIVKYLDVYDLEDFVDKNFKNRLINNIYASIKTNEISYQKSINLNKVTLHYPSKDLRKAKIDFGNYNIIDKEQISMMYNKFLKLIIQNKIEKYLYNNKEGIVYKYDIYALGVSIFRMGNILEINDAEFYNLVKNMVMTDPDERYNSAECLQHDYLRNLKIDRLETKNKNLQDELDILKERYLRKISKSRKRKSKKDSGYSSK